MAARGLQIAPAAYARTGGALYLLIFVYLWRRRRGTAGHGELLGRYLVLAGIARFAVEFVRRNPAWLLGLTTAQWTSVGAVLVGGVLVLAVRRVAARHAAEPLAASA